MTGASDQAWVRWWCEAWRGAHASWQAGFAKHVGLTLSACEALAQYQPEPFMRYTGMTSPQPPAPDANTLQWLALQPAQQQLALALVAQICNPGRLIDEAVDAHVLWCRGLAKALRPGLWIKAYEPEAEWGVSLLQPWIGRDCWTRLRLNWPMASSRTVERDETPIAAAHTRLQTLWPAVLWRVNASTLRITEV